MTLFSYFILFITALAGGLAFLFFKKSNPKYLKLSLAFSGAFLFAITITHLIPEVYASGSHDVGYYVLLGFLFQIVLELFSEGIEHGHVHIHKKEHGIFPFAVIISLCVHSFFEGMPLAQETDDEVRKTLLTGIVLHHLPVAFALMNLLILSGISLARSVSFLALFALMAPLGGMVSNSISTELGSSGEFFDNVMGIVIGIFLHISTTILFETSEQHRFNLLKMGAILAGVGLSLVSF